MKKLSLILLLALSNAFSICAQDSETSQTQTKPQTETQTQPQTEVTVTYEIFQQGTYSGIKDALAEVITNKKDWQELWKKHTSVIVPQPLVPEIDFDTDVVAVIFSGEKRTSGYRIVLKSIEAEGNDVVVNYLETEPPADSFTLQVLSQPFLMIKISKPVGSVRLVKKTGA
jgi:hypothetical protein